MDRLKMYPNDDDWDKRGRGTKEDFDRSREKFWAHFRAMFKRK